MPVSPEISLGVTGGAPASAGGSALVSPLDTISKFATIQNSLNQNRLFQQTFEARKAIGQIMATSPDIDSGIQRILQSPHAAFAAEAANTMRQGQLTLMQIAKERQGMAQGGLAFVLKGLGGALADPSSLESLLNTGLSTVDPQAQPQVKSGIKSIVDSLGHGLPSDPAAARQMFSARLSGMLLSSGWTPEAMHEMTGTPGMQDLGGQRVPSVQLPAWAGPGIRTAPGLATSPVPRVEMTPTGPGGASEPTQLGGSAGALGVGGPAQAPGSGFPAAAPNALGGAALPVTAPPAVAAPAAPPSAVDPLQQFGVDLPASPRLNPPGRGLSQAQKDNISQRQGKMADYEAKLDIDVNTANIFAKNMQEMADMAKVAQLGGGAETYKRLGQTLQAFGVKNPTVDKWANGSLAASQVVDKVSLDNVMLRAKQMLEGIGGSRFNMQEFIQLLQKNPNVTTDPRAIQQIFNLWNQYNTRYRAEQQALGEAKRRGVDIGEWPAVWQNSRYMKEFAPERLDMEGMRGGGPVSGSRPALESFFR